MDPNESKDPVEAQPAREVSEGELAEGVELEIETVHELEIDPGFMFSG